MGSQDFDFCRELRDRPPLPCMSGNRTRSLCFPASRTLGRGPQGQTVVASLLFPARKVSVGTRWTVRATPAQQEGGSPVSGGTAVVVGNPVLSGRAMMTQPPSPLAKWCQRQVAKTGLSKTQSLIT